MDELAAALVDGLWGFGEPGVGAGVDAAGAYGQQAVGRGLEEEDLIAGELELRVE